MIAYNHRRMLKVRLLKMNPRLVMQNHPNRSCPIYVSKVFGLKALEPGWSSYEKKTESILFFLNQILLDEIHLSNDIFTNPLFSISQRLSGYCSSRIPTL